MESAILGGQEPLHVQMLVHIQYLIRLKPNLTGQYVTANGSGNGLPETACVHVASRMVPLRPASLSVRRSHNSKSKTNGMPEIRWPRGQITYKMYLTSKLAHILYVIGAKTRTKS